MALTSWNNDVSLGKIPCTEERQTWQCPNMKPVEGDTSMEYEHYACSLCGKKIKLDYEEMR